MPVPLKRNSSAGTFASDTLGFDEFSSSSGQACSPTAKAPAVFMQLPPDLILKRRTQNVGTHTMMMPLDTLLLLRSHRIHSSSHSGGHPTNVIITNFRAYESTTKQASFGRNAFIMRGRGFPRISNLEFPGMITNRTRRLAPLLFRWWTLLLEKAFADIKLRQSDSHHHPTSQRRVPLFPSTTRRRVSRVGLNGQLQEESSRQHQS